MSAQGAAEEDAVVAKLRNMHVSASRGARFQPTYSLVHRLVNVYGHSSASGLRVSAHRFLDHPGLLQSRSPAYATRLEVVFCERLRQLGYYDVAREVLAWLPRTPAVTYVLGRLWLDEGRYDDAGSAFEVLAGSFGKRTMPLLSAGAPLVRTIANCVEQARTLHCRARTRTL